jgi:hypothetical protein
VSSGQSSWLQIRRPGFDSRHYEKKKVVGLERGPLSLVSTTEQLLDRKSSGSCLANREYGRRDPPRWPRGTLYPQKIGNHLADKRRSLGRYSSLADSDHGFFLFGPQYRVFFPLTAIRLKGFSVRETEGWRNIDNWSQIYTQSEKKNSH